MSLVLIFIGAFLVGPLAFYLALKRPPTERTLQVLACVVVIAVGMGVVLWAIAAPDAAIWFVAAVLLLIWVGWIALLAWAAQLIQRLDTRPQVRRWAVMVGVVCTTAPWFGLASAQTMLG